MKTIMYAVLLAALAAMTGCSSAPVVPQNLLTSESFANLPIAPVILVVSDITRCPETAIPGVECVTSKDLWIDKKETKTDRTKPYIKVEKGCEVLNETTTTGGILGSVISIAASTIPVVGQGLGIGLQGLHINNSGENNGRWQCHFDVMNSEKGITTFYCPVGLENEPQCRELLFKTLKDRAAAPTAAEFTNLKPSS